MIWLVRDFDLLSLLLRALSFALEALSLGCVCFLFIAGRPDRLPSRESVHLRRIGAGFAIGLACVEILLIAITSAVIVSSSGIGGRDLLREPFFLAGICFAVAALLLAALLRWTGGVIGPAVAALAALAASVSLSHAASRVDHRLLLFVLTGAHHLGMAAWLGALPFLLIALRRSDSDQQTLSLARRFSTMALCSVAMLVLAGTGLSWFYVGSWHVMAGTSYGILLSAKIVLTALMLLLGAGNYYLIRDGNNGLATLRVHLRRFSEVELGLGLTVLLAAASLTAQAPSVDETLSDTLTGQEIAQRMAIHWPSFHTPALAQLAPPTPLSIAVREAAFTGGGASDANDRAWSEYNHHWAGLIVLAAGALALLSRAPRQRWAQHWPLLFLGLSAFILLRADPECWPLGPRPFWPSFTAPDVLEHRLYALLVAIFAFFEWGVQTGRLRWPPARFVFPALAAVGGALLLTHTHGTSDGKDEVFAEISHTPIALAGAVAGWGRWLEIRTPPAERSQHVSRIAAWLWPLCLIIVGLLLLNYRES